VPKTIDGDVAVTEATLGFATAVTVATEALDRLEATASSHHRMLALEVMGRHCGRLALHAALASGADGVLLAEFPFRPEKILDLVQTRRNEARFSVIVVAEGAHPAGEPERHRRAHAGGAAQPLGGIAEEVAGLVERATGVEARSVVLGHVVRGAAPVAEDRILAARFAAAAVELARERCPSAVLALQKGVVAPVPLERVAGVTNILTPGDEAVRAARRVGISLCD
jgi:6-phosphofructokinase 1